MIFHTQPHPNGKDIIVSSPKPENWRCSTREEETLAAIGARFNRKESGRCKVVYTASRAQWRDLCRLVDAGWRGDRWALANPKEVESRTFWHPDYGEESFSRADALALCPPVSQRCKRTAVILARDMQKRLNAEHRLVEHYSEKHRKACEHNRRLNNELSALKAKLECPSTPDRVSDVAMLRAENSAVRDELAMVKADRDRLAAVADNHAGAISALVDRIARAETAMRRAGIAAGPVAVAA